MPLLLAKKIYKRYPISGGYFYALRPCSVSFPSRGLVAIKGKSGSGKSTLLHLLSGIEKADGGEVYYQQCPRKQRKHPLLGYEASIVFQHYNLIEGESALYNVCLPLLMRGKGRGNAKKILVDLGLNKLIHKDVRLLSGGEKQRVAIARALASDPTIIFADEPTGALDEVNSETVMQTLRQIASSRLVLMVSHNEDLIARYAERVIEIVDGSIIADQGSVQAKDSHPKEKKYAHRRSWIGRFILRNIKRNAFKDAMCFLSGVIGFSALLLSFGFLVGNMPAMEAEMTHSLCYLSATVAKKSIIEIPGSAFTLVKQVRPEADEVREVLTEIGEFDVADDYGYFLPSSMTFRVGEDVFEPTSFQGIFDITLQEHGKDMLFEGEFPRGAGFNECVVNKEFLDHFGADLLGKTINIASRSVLTIGSKQQEVFVEAGLRIAGAVREFGFLNVPRVYYSFHQARNYLHDYKIEDENGDETSLAELVEGAEPDGIWGNYSRQLFFHDVAQIDSLFSWIKEHPSSDIEVNSISYGLHESFSSLSLAFTSSLGLFVGIALIGLCLILGMASYSSFIAGKKENAILTVLGARGKDVVAIYMFEATFLCLGSAIVAFCLSPLLQWILNLFLKGQFDVMGLINIPYEAYLGVRFLVPIALFGFALALGLLSSFVPMRIGKKMAIVEELRDE